MEKYIQIHNQLMDFSCPRVMAIVNLSRESFYTSCDIYDEQNFLSYVENLLCAGADILDVGACSTRPNSIAVSTDVERQLMKKGIEIIRYHWPDAIISVDTFRAEIAELAIMLGADMINDVYGGMDRNIWDVVAKCQVPYILTHAQRIERASMNYDSTMSQVLDFFQQKLNMLRRYPINDVVIDPGFGFEKDIEQNYTILRQLDVLSCLHAPILIGLSRKSMLYKPLNTVPEQVLPATIAAHMIALNKGANILRVHDVSAAVQAIKIHNLTYNSIKS